MYCTVYLYNDKPCLIVTKRKADAIKAINKLHDNDLVMIWRMHDGDGWCDGSPDAWQHINNLPTFPVYVAYALQ